MPTTCRDVPTMSSERQHKERKRVGEDGERICPRCFALNVERWATSPTCVRIQHFQAIGVVLSVVQEDKHDKHEIDHVRTSYCLISIAHARRSSSVLLPIRIALIGTHDSCHPTIYSTVQKVQYISLATATAESQNVNLLLPNSFTITSPSSAGGQV